MQQQTNTSVLAVEGLVKHYDPPKGVMAVDGVSFSIPPGEVFSLLGPNGAGKTTIISMICGLLSPTAGDAVIGGHSIRRQPALAKSLMGVVPQEVAVYGDLSAQENLSFFGRMYGLRGEKLAERVREVLQTTGLADRARERVAKFSGGMKRRLNIGLALLHQPRLLILDEPTVGIDPQSRRHILDEVIALNRAGTSVLYTTHYMEEAQELSHTIAIMDHGRIIARGSHAELVQQVGEVDHLELVTSQSPEQALEIWKDVEGVTKAFVQDGKTVLWAKAGDALLPRLFERAAAVGLRVLSVQVQEPNLESVFLHLTGRALRDT
jgi:ABC-2 type transport system ATP-binding protein